MKSVRIAIVLLAVASAPALAASLDVTQKDQTFSTPNLAVHPGDSVRFNNADTVTHNITVKATAGDDDADDLGLQKPGQSVSQKFATAGVYRVICSIHPRMKMTVTVK